MTTTINQDIDIDLQEVYDDLWSSEQREFLLDNIDDLEDDDLIAELSDRGYDITNPWISVKERLPEMTEETKGYQNSPEVLVCHRNGKIGTMYYSYAYGRWEIDGGGMPAPLYWKPITLPTRSGDYETGALTEYRVKQIKI